MGFSVILMAEVCHWGVDAELLIGTTGVVGAEPPCGVPVTGIDKIILLENQ